mmetsp:Transcript_703/g.894  ORF Transcript_703/g.894 Transcript_703/m.894 type:complete len:972 (+) Transcript_703:13-2928(+)
MKLFISVTFVFVWIVGSITAINLQDDKKIENDFINWFRDNGGVLGGIELHQFENMGRGVKASKDLKADDVIISVPLSICMSRLTASESSSPTINNMFKSLENDEDLIALMLMRERGMGELSSWSSYIKTLPTLIPQGAYFDEEALQTLNDPALAHKLKRRGDGIKSRYKNLGAELHVLKNFIKSQLKKTTQFTNDKDVDDAAVLSTSLGRYQWALSIVSSRALTFRGERFLAPMCDMFNYSPHESARALESGAFYLRHHKLDKQNKKTLTVTADRDTLKGQQVFEDYGDNPSSLYLDHHGFVPHTNPFDCVSMDLPTPTSITDQTIKQTLSDRLRISTSPSACVFVPPSLLAENAGDTLISDYGLSSEVWSWLMLHYELDQTVLTKCLSLLDRYAAGEDRTMLLDEVKNGACDLLSSGPKPPQNWTPSENVLKNVLLPAMLKRQEQMKMVSDLKKEDKESKKNMDVTLAHAYRKEQFILLNKLISFTQSVLSPPSSSSSHQAENVEVEVDALSSTTSTSMTSSSLESNIWTQHSDCENTNSNDSFLCAIAVFNQWVRSKNFPVQKIEARQVPGMRVGTLAIEPIQAEELYLAVPTNAVMDFSSASSSNALVESGLFQRLKKSGDGDFYALLFHLLYEFKVLGTESEYWPYMRLLPSLAEIKPPAEYSETEMALLEGSHVQSSILQYKSEILKRWDVVKDKSFLGPAFKTLFPTLTEAEFRWGHYILDSRSIWWNNKRHLVPLLDLINCGEGDWLEKGRDSPNRVHSTKQSSHMDRHHGTTIETADTYSSQELKIGEQLFENYGQPNNIYLQYHGFVLDDNSHDCVSVSIPIESGDEGMLDVKNLRKRMKQYGFSTGVQTFCIGNAAILKEALRLKNTNTPMNWQKLGDGRLLTWLALKYGRSIGSDIREPFKQVVTKLLNQYPSSSSSESSKSGEEAEAGEGIGGGKGSNHPAAKLVRKEIELLETLQSLL